MSRSVSTLLALLGTALATPAPAIAREAGEPAANRTPDARDVALTPLTDLNLRKDEIPPVLLAALADPYESATIRKCAQVAAALAPLDAALGPDMDVIDRTSERLSPGVVAKSVIASFVPFRGILREVTGAAEHERTYEAAIYAGAVRRGFLKGLGQQMRCPYPNRPAFTRVTVTDPRAASLPAESRKRAKGGPAAATFVSEAVVQGASR